MALCPTGKFEPYSTSSVWPPLPPNIRSVLDSYHRHPCLHRVGCVCIRVHSSPSPSARESFQKLRYLDFSDRASGVMDVLRDTEVTIDLLHLCHLPLLLLEAVFNSSLSINEVAVEVQRFPDQVRKLIVSHLIGHSGFARDGGMLLILVYGLMKCIHQAAYTHRSIWSVGFILVGLIWPFAWGDRTRSENWGWRFVWGAVCVITGIFPLLSVDKRESLASM